MVCAYVLSHACVLLQEAYTLLTDEVLTLIQVSDNPNLRRVCAALCTAL